MSSFLYNFLYWIKVFSAIFSFIFFVLFLRFFFKRKDLRRKEKIRWEEHFRDKKENFQLSQEENEWKKIFEDLNSPEENDRKMALIRADDLLEKYLEKFIPELRGNESFGEKLKNLEKDKYPFLEEVWEIHKTRNYIAHGGAFPFRKEDAQRISFLLNSIFSYFS